MAAIAAFAASDQGKTFAAVHDRFGSDPAAGFADDVLAFNLRAALMFSHPFALELDSKDEKPRDITDWETAAAVNEREWLKGVQ